MATKKKVIKKKAPNGTNVRINAVSFKIIKDFCDDRGYKIGAFVETAALKRVNAETTCL